MKTRTLEQREKRAAYEAAWRIANREKVKAAQARYCAANKKKVNARIVAWRKLNPPTKEQRARWHAVRRDKARAYNATRPAEALKRKKITTALWITNNKGRVAETKRLWAATNRAVVNAHNSERRARRLQATPAWAEHEKISAVYAEATAHGMHVDHVIPLKSSLVCGLHVHNNLQLLPGVENIRKGNRWWPDMPGVLS